jgi:hypothetical protein
MYLVEFLRTLVKLKKENKIDAIIMYTNQYEENEVNKPVIISDYSHAAIVISPVFAFVTKTITT